MDLGIERLLVKNGKMIMYFVGEQTSPFYQSALFAAILRFVQLQILPCRFSEKNNKLSLVFTEITNIMKMSRYVREMWEKSIRECTDEQSFEEASWEIIEGNFRRYEAYLEFAADYVLSYAENWCRENQIPFVETEELVDPPTHPYMFIDDVEDVLSYLKQGWSVEDYMNMLRQFNPDVEDFSAITPAIEAAVEQMKKDSGKQA